MVTLLWVTRAGRAGPVQADDAGETADVLRDAIRDTISATGRFALRLLPLFVAVAFLGGLLTQWLTVDGVESVGGFHLTGVLIAVAVGLLIDLPLTFGVAVAASRSSSASIRSWWACCSLHFRLPGRGRSGR